MRDIDPGLNFPAMARKLEVNGIVQGVGFRPFIYQLAARHGLAGTVANTAAGVFIHVEGLPGALDAFREAIEREKPPLAHITGVVERPADFEGFNDFSISESREDAHRSTLISPDVSVCDDCRRELFDPSDRRFGYPFINCTNCGPRYTIIDDIPYDRPHTSMKHFAMCAPCRAEYDDPGNRRFHAQPNACADCGPHIVLYDSDRKALVPDDPISETARLLKAGHIVAIKGLGGFHLAVDAENTGAVDRLRQRKHRVEKPFALMSGDPDHIRTYAHIGPDEEALLTSPQRPIVLLKKREPNAISGAVSPGNNCFGVMLPYTPLHYLLLSNGFTALVMTSGNLSDEPIAIDNDDAFFRLAGIADYFLVHNREIYLRSDDSIVRHTAGAARFLRRSRGYVPIPVFLDGEIPPILACGAELKNTICMAKRDHAFLSQHIGDLENLRTLDFFRLTIRHMKRILDIEPEAIAHDLHPDYMSTRHALEQKGVPLIPVQHHHAHIAACMAENRIQGPVIGLSFDGTGYGTDGHIWGGEVLVADFAGFTRAGHLEYLPMPGGEAAIREPWRMAVSYLKAAYGDGFRNLDLPLFREIEPKKIDILSEMIDKRIHSPLTSSLGRLFDGVAAILGIRSRVNFEGQAAMELEMHAPDAINLLKNDGFHEYEEASGSAGNPGPISVRPIIRGVVDDMIRGMPVAEISARFHAALVRLFAHACEQIRKTEGLNRVALSGGVFQNALLLNGMIAALEQKGFDVYSHRLVPANDGGISLGQAVVAGTQLSRKSRARNTKFETNPNDRNKKGNHEGHEGP